MNRSLVTVLFAITSFSFLLRVHSLPLDYEKVEEELRSSREAVDEFGFPIDTPTVDEKPNNGCFVDVATKVMEMVFISTDDDGEEGEYVFTPRTIRTRKCCEGYAGTECDVVIDPFLASNPCTNQTCPNHPEAICAVVDQCDEEVPVFINEQGQVVDCGNDEPQPQPSDDQQIDQAVEQQLETNVTNLVCQGFCDFNPCENQACTLFPEAFCFQSGCDCQPIWIIETGVQVNCTSGAHIDPLISLARSRSRREAVVSSACTS